MNPTHNQPSALNSDTITLTDKESIEEWLKNHNIKNYTINPVDMSVTVHGSVNLVNQELTHLPVKFLEVKGDFDCSENFLTSLKNAPSEVVGSYLCQDNELTSLEFSPQKINGDFDCSDNKITSLLHAPQKVGLMFCCNNNDLESLEFCPKSVGQEFYCYENPRLGSIQNSCSFKKIYAHTKPYRERARIQKQIHVKDDEAQVRSKYKI